MHDALTDVAGIEVGHAEDLTALTGCTVVLCRSGAVVGVDVRGLAPGTRETDLCRAGTLVEQAHAIVLAGGSAFGLEAATGVMRYLREQNVGFETGVMRVPIVPAAVIFDLAVGEVAWPDAEMGYRACLVARDGPFAQGTVGAGTGATVGKMLGPDRATKSGVGTASVTSGELIVSALMVVNAFGNVWEPGNSRIAAGARGAETGAFSDIATSARQFIPPAGTNTTIGVIATNAGLDSAGINQLASIAHDGLARTIRPVHTIFDGDTIFGLATGQPSETEPALFLRLQVAAVEAVERAVRNAIRHATAAGGLPSAGDQRGAS